MEVSTGRRYGISEDNFSRKCTKSRRVQKKVTCETPSQVEHGSLQNRTNTASPNPFSISVDFLFGQVGKVFVANVSRCQEFVDVASSTFASEIGVEGGWDETDGPRGTTEHVGGGVGEALEAVGGESVLIVNDVVMGRTSSALNATVSLEEEVEVVDSRYTAIDNGSRAGIAVSIGSSAVDGVEPSMVAFTSNAKSNLGAIDTVR